MTQFDLSWMDKGNCKGLPYEVMNPTPPPSGNKPRNHDPLTDPRSQLDFENFAKAKFCSSCVVKDQCLSYAVETGQRKGVWGNTNHEERHILIKEAGTSFYDHAIGQY